MKSNAVVFLGMVYPAGGVRHLGLLGAELSIQNRGQYDFYFASVGAENNVGFWRLVRESIPKDRILVEDGFGELVERIANLANVYDKVLVHLGGGWSQTRFFLKAVRRLGRARAKRIILVGTTHSYRNGTKMRIPMSILQCCLYLLFYRMIVFQCRYARQRFCGGWLLTLLGKGAVIPLGCEEFPVVGEAVPDGIRSIGLAEMLLDQSLVKIVYLAQFRPGKMHEWLVKAISPMLKRHREARIILCGKTDNAIAARIKEIVGGLGLESQVVIPGFVPRDEVPWLLQHVNCAVVPSRSETFGHNFLEPMFAGLPVVGTRVGVGCDIIKDGETGYFFDLRDPRSVCRALEDVVLNPKKAAQMGANAKDLVMRSYRHADVARQLTSLYERLLGE